MTFRLIICLALIWAVCAVKAAAAEELVKVIFHGPYNPSISRFTSCSIYITSAGIEALDLDTLKFFVNDRDQTQFLQPEFNTQNQDLYFLYRPRKALPLGIVTQKLKALGKDGQVFTKEWTITVNPAAGPVLAPLVAKIKKQPADYKAHYALAQAFQKKHMLEDAAYEYLRVLRYNPKHDKAKAAFQNIFKFWDRKAISKESVVIEVARDTEVEKQGKLLLFKVQLFNGAAKTLNFDPEDISIVIDGEKGANPILNFTDYPKKMLENGNITVDDYAKFSYLMEKRNLSGLSRTDVAPDARVSGYVGFPLASLKYKHFTLYLPLRLPSGKTFEYKFPFMGKN